MGNRLLTVQDVLPKMAGTSWGCGFNQRVHGDSYDKLCSQRSYDFIDRAAGFEHAQKMIDEGLIYYTHVFPHGNCKGHAFTYGGTFVCNDCGGSRLDRPWWNIKIQKDGDAWFVCGEGFENLQESENYAFGNTKQEAFVNYKIQMEKP